MSEGNHQRHEVTANEIESTSDEMVNQKKYSLLLFLMPLIIAETIVQANYFFRLSPNVITSCCGTFISTAAEGVKTGIVVPLPFPLNIVFYFTMEAAIITDLYY